jgi:hypothetical protein
MEGGRITAETWPFRLGFGCLGLPGLLDVECNDWTPWKVTCGERGSVCVWMGVDVAYFKIHHCNG